MFLNALIDKEFWNIFYVREALILLPNIPPKVFSLSAVVVGYILIDDATANEQNAIGNWLMLVAQVLSTNAFYRAVMQERGLEPVGSTETGRNNADTFSGMYGQSSGNVDTNSNSSSDENNETLEMLEKMIRALQIEVDNIKRNLNL